MKESFSVKLFETSIQPACYSYCAQNTSSPEILQIFEIWQHTRDYCLFLRLSWSSILINKVSQLEKTQPNKSLIHESINLLVFFFFLVFFLFLSMWTTLLYRDSCVSNTSFNCESAKTKMLIYFSQYTLFVSTLCIIHTTTVLYIKQTTIKITKTMQQLNLFRKVFQRI